MNTTFRSRKPILEAAFAGFIFATVSYDLYFVSQQGCGLLHTIGWAAIEILRHVAVAASQSAPAPVCVAASLLQHAVQFLASICPVFCLIIS